MLDESTVADVEGMMVEGDEDKILLLFVSEKRS